MERCFSSLCEELGITINELMSGERINKEEYQKKFEENIVNTIDYSTKKLNKYSQAISLILIIFGLFISLSAIMIFPSESSWGSIYSIFGIIVFTIGIALIIRKMKLGKRILLVSMIFIGALFILFLTDYINVKLHNQAPMFRTRTTFVGNVIYYDTPFYDVYRCNFDEKDEYWVISKNDNPTDDELIDYCK